MTKWLTRSRSRIGIAILATVSIIVSVAVLDVDEHYSVQLQTTPFLTGVNYPWHSYGRDFGMSAWGHNGVSEPSSRQAVEADFSYLESMNVKVVRWFLFCDGRSGLVYGADGKVIGLDAKVFDDIDAALEIAARHRIAIVFVLVDFHLLNHARMVNGVQAGGRAQLIADNQLRRSLLDNAFLPVLERYGKRREIFAWEIINEPEWAMQVHRVPPATVQQIGSAPMLDFAKEAAALVHDKASQKVTLGSASSAFLMLWEKVGLDFLQVHHYRTLGPLTIKSASSYKTNLPIVVGEFPSSGREEALTLYLTRFQSKGYAGAWVWSLNASDRYTDLKSKRETWRKWHAKPPKPAQPQPAKPGP